MSIDVQKTPDYLIFAEEAKPGEFIAFPDISRGWGLTSERTGKKPPMEWFNGAFNRVDRHLLYLLQQGVPEWNDKVTYPVNAVIKYNGILYIATNENNNAKPSTTTTKWKKLLDDASLTKKGIVQLNSAVNSVSESEAATPKAVKAAYDKALNAFPKTGGTVNGLIKSNQPKTYDIVASKDWLRSVSNTFPKAILAHEAGGGGFAIVTGADDARLGKTANLTFASWNGVGFAPMQTGDKEDKAINSTVVVNCRLGTVYAMGDFYAQGKKLIKQDEYGVGHQNLSLTKISDNLNEQNASFFGSTYVNMPESIKPYVNKGSGVVGFVLPYRATDKGWNFSARIYAEVGVTPLNLCYQENRDDTWQKPIKLITEENVNDILPVGIPQPWPTTTPPTGWLKCDGSAFDKNKYPLLAKAYQSGFLPDLRGEFIRGLDNGANIDLDRVILSKQGDQARNATGFWFCKNRGGVDGELITYTSGGKTGGDAGGQGEKHTIDFSNVWPTGDEFRPRNIAFLYIVKAA